MMSRKPVDLVLTRLDPKRSLTAPQQIAWLHATHVPLRGIHIDMSSFLAHHVDTNETAAMELAVSSDVLATSMPYLQVAAPAVYAFQPNLKSSLTDTDLAMMMLTLCLSPIRADANLWMTMCAIQHPFVQLE